MALQAQEPRPSFGLQKPVGAPVENAFLQQSRIQ